MGLFSSLFSKSISTVDPNKAQELIKNGALLIDVREPQEWKQGHAPSARHIPLGQLQTKLNTLPKDRQVLTICAVGGRASRAAASLKRAGFEAINVKGGMRAWQSAGLPVVGRGKGGRVA